MSVEQEPNRAIRTYVETGGPKEWRHKDVAQNLYAWADVLRYYFFSPSDDHQPELPQPLVAVAPLRVDTLAAYRIVPNPLGLSYEITMNSVHLDRPQWEILETLCHELTHLFQENTPGLEQSKRGYHNQQFVAIAEQIGLHPRLGSGAHWKPADGQFARLMERYGVEQPAYAVAVIPPSDKKKYWWDEDRGGKKGNSTLVLYTAAECSRRPICKIRAGRRDLHIACRDCKGEFVPNA